MAEFLTVQDFACGKANELFLECLFARMSTTFTHLRILSQRYAALLLSIRKQDRKLACRSIIRLWENSTRH